MIGVKRLKTGKRPQEFLNDLRTHSADRSQRPAANDCGGRGLKYFQTVEGVQHGSAGHHHAVIFKKRYWISRPHGRRHFFAVAELMFERDLSDIFYKKVTCRNCAVIEGKVAGAERGTVERQCVNDRLDFGMCAVNRPVEPGCPAGHLVRRVLAVADEY